MGNTLSIDTEPSNSLADIYYLDRFDSLVASAKRQTTLENYPFGLSRARQETPWNVIRAKT